MKVGVDTNILFYAEGLDDAVRMNAARKLLARLPKSRLVIPVQVFGELFSLLVRKGRFPPAEARRRVGDLQRGCEAWSTTLPVFQAALDLAAAHALQLWDAVILAAVSEAGCDLLISEDYQHGLTLRGVMIVDPFRSPPHPRLGAMLAL